MMARRGSWNTTSLTTGRNRDFAAGLQGFSP
jgi:hypothetical protein